MEKLELSTGEIKAQVLADMGVWRFVPRDSLARLEAKPAPGAIPDTLPAAGTPAHGRVPALAELAASLAEPSAAAATGRRLSPGPVATPDAPPLELTPDVASEVACYWHGSVILFCGTENFSGRARLIKDTLAAVSGVWPAKAQQALYRWQDLKDSGLSSSNPQRALLAFAQQRLDKADVSWVLTCRSLRASLDGLRLSAEQQRCEIPVLPQLARDGQAKQLLWRDICRLHGGNLHGEAK